MDNPISDIPAAINACAGAPDPDSQVDAFHKYFTPDAEFIHPLCHVPSRADSRTRIIGIYLFYRIAIPLTRFEISEVAFAEAKDGTRGKLFVDMYQFPWLRGTSLVTGGWRPRIPMHVHFWLRKEVDVTGGQQSRWYIEKQMDTISGYTFMMALPPLRPFCYLFYLMCEIMGLLSAYIFTMLGFWRPTQHLRRRTLGAKQHQT